MDQALADDDRRYLRGLGAHGMALEARLDEAYPPKAAALEKFERQEREAAAKLNGQGLTVQDQTDLQSENERLRAELAALRGGQDSQPPVETETNEVPNYTGWKKAELEAEVDRVNADDPEAGLSKGTVAEMTEALTAYFTEE